MSSQKIGKKGKPEVSALAKTPTADLDKNSKDGATKVSKWLCLLLAITLVPSLAGLGVWQLDRADEKQQLLERADQQPLLKSLPNVSNTALLPQAVRLQVNLDTQRLLLLDNRTRQGRVGYELLSLFQDLGSKRWGIVNLGWAEASMDRSQLPSNPLPSYPSDLSVELRGTLISANAGYQLQQDHWQSGWPKRIQQPDIDKFEQLFGQPLYPAVLRLTEPLHVTLQTPLDTDWSLVNMSPAKHLGYAVQWFGLAFALLALLVWYGWLRHWRGFQSRSVVDSIATTPKTVSQPQQSTGVTR